MEVRAADHRGCNETWNLEMQASSESRVSLRCVANDAAGCLIGKRIEEGALDAMPQNGADGAHGADGQD